MQTGPEPSRSADLEEVAARLAAAAEAAVAAGRRLPPHEPLAGQLDGMAHLLWRFRSLLQDAGGDGAAPAAPRAGDAGAGPRVRGR